MRKILVAGTAALFTAMAFAAAPAAAGSFNFNIGVGGWGPGWYGPGYGGIYLAPAPLYVSPQSNWAAHVNWCFNHHPSYNANTNTYVTNSGKVKVCYSPFA